VDESGIASFRARALDRFVDVARYVLRQRSELKSVMLLCAQYWCDEAEDAVQSRLVASRELVPYNAEEVPWQVRLERLAWNENTDAVWAFSAMCTEEGYEEATGRVNEELKDVYRAIYSPLAIAQRDGASMRVHWLGALHRAWWDFPQAAARERSYPFSGNANVTEPEPRPLLGVEPALVEQFLAGDDAALEVLRDAWTLRGDPRGELCAPVSTSRLADLVAQYGRAWVGALQPVIPLSGALFGPGPFVRKAVVYADRDTFVRVADAPEWGSLESITFAEGSYRALSPRMHRLRAVGPLDRRQLLALHGTQIEDVEYDDPASLPDLARMAPLLRVLRIRGRFDTRTLAAFPSLQRLELWLPAVEGAAAAIVEAFDDLARVAPPDLRIVVGRLDCGVRSGWVLAGTTRERRIEIVRPDARTEMAAELATLTGLELPMPLLDGDDWLALALGVPSLVEL
jgi:hypothetical protein